MQKKNELSFYRRVISDALRIAWRHKHLWVFGFFAAVVGFGGATEAIFSGSDRVFAFFPAISSGKPIAAALPGLATVRAIAQFSPFPALAILVFLAIMTLFACVFLWMSYVSAGALVSGARKIAQGGEPSFGDGLKLGAEKFWRVLGVNLISQAIIFCGYVLTATTLFVLMSDRTVTSGIFYVGTFIVFTLVALAASVAAIYSTCFVITKDKATMPALSAGWRLLFDHWLVSLEMAVALFVSSLVIGLSAVLASLIVSVPFIFMLIVAAVLKLSTASFLVLMTASALMLAMIVCVGSFITVFQASAWTLLWGEMTEKKPLAKLHRLARRLSKHLV